LARSVDLFDEILTFTFFAEETRTLEGAVQAPDAVRLAHMRFRQLVTGSYDLAIDLRYDPETRRLLTLVDAKRRIGVGDLNEFPFLDLAVPSERRPARPLRRAGEVGVQKATFSPAEAPARMSPAAKDLVLRLELDGTSSPVEFGLSPDGRSLGVALKKVRVTRALAEPVGWHESERIFPRPPASEEAKSERPPPPRPHDKPLSLGETVKVDQESASAAWFESGFSDLESIGAWTVARSATFRLPVEAGVNRPLQLHLEFLGFVHPASPNRSLALWCNGEQIARATIAYPQDSGALVVDVPAHLLEDAPTSVVSHPFVAGSGKCRVRPAIRGFGAADLSGASSVTVEVVNEIGRVMASRSSVGADLIRGLREELEFLQDDPELPLRLRVTARGVPFAAGIELQGAEITTESSGDVPTLHMTDWIGLVVDVTIRHFAPGVDQLEIPDEQLPPELETAFALDEKAGRKIILIATGTSKDVTKWPLEHYEELVGSLADAIPSTVYLVGAPRERSEAQTIVDKHGRDKRVVNICGMTKLSQLGTVLKRGHLFIGGSTGSTHGASMAGIPTIALLSGVNYPQQWAPVGARAEYLAKAVPCFGCHILFMSDCQHGYRCMMELTPRIVLERAIALLGGGLSATSRTSRAGRKKNG
jgi:ADP-heptose:LPS heptosyltransferase